ncbi:sulfite exporter TauE/SafE family protein [Streptomonospora sp. PA3]|uniref:sulfite exporter TauE/SafE family protein n=1 Tax=Streptomonospora sp. PA3 TaxID=2607326 RepID=UPI0012DF409E|nr:sulfite exporter TauE/SafE family protein [Streptomonospora sp. PA3]MUL42450.1 sulfite exporter TauE/SafE family protein [Streptomonospora sp. PA3]
MSPWEALAILLAGIGAGGINAVVGSGTLLTFPVLLAFGYPPVTASISNSIGLAPGTITGTFGYRRELRGQGRRVLRLAAMSCLGALTGGVLLLNLPAEVFERVVPVLIGLACVLIILQPRLARRLRERRSARAGRGPLLPLGVYAAGTYGGYFAAAQGIVLISVLGTALDEDMQRINALKNALAATVNATAAVFYITFGSPSWAAAGLIAGGSIIGGYAGAWLGRRLKPFALRGLIVAVGLTAAVQLVLEQF